MEEDPGGGASPPKPTQQQQQLPAAQLPAALQQSATTGEEEEAGSSKAIAPPPPRAVAPFDLDFDNEASAAAASNPDRDDLLLDWRRYSNEGQGYGDYGSKALGYFLTALAFLGRRAGLRDDYESATFVAASLPPPPPAWWLRQSRARKRALLACGAAFLVVGTLALVAIAGAVALRSSSSADDFLASEEAGIFGGGSWPAMGAPECAWKSWRLPREVSPRRYRLLLSLSDLETDAPRVEGDAVIDVSLVPSSPSSSSGSPKKTAEITKPQRCIVLHAAAPVGLDSATITIASPKTKEKEKKKEKASGGEEEEEEEAGSSSSPFDVSTRRITTWRFDSATDQLTLLLPSPLEAHHAATLRLRFSYGLPDALEGLYRSTWTEEEAEAGEQEREAAGGAGAKNSSSSNRPRKKILRAAAVSQFEANSARTAFPCFDEPSLRAPFQVSIEADEGLAAISNMPAASVEEAGEVSEAEEASKRDRRAKKKKKKKEKASNAPPFPPPASFPSSRPRRRLRHVFDPTPAMPTYLVAVVVGPLVAVPGGHLLPPPADISSSMSTLPLPPARTMPPPLPGGGNGNDLASPPSEAAFDAAAAAAGLSPWKGASSPSRSSTTTTKRPLTLYARPAAAPLLRLAARAARGALAAHERSLGIRYALPHLQIIAVPDFSANAMENWGAVVFREAALLLLDDEGDDDDEIKQQQEGVEEQQLSPSFPPQHLLLPSPNAASAERRVALTLSHELAHMFFGDAVGFQWWSELWLSESFATYLEHGAAAAALAEVMMTVTKESGGGSSSSSSSPSSSIVNFFDSFFDSTASVGLRAAARSRSGHALSARFPVSTLHNNAGIESMFDRIEYEHGAAVLRMLRSYMNAGKEVEEEEVEVEEEASGRREASSSSSASAALDDGALGGGSGPSSDRFLAGLRDYQRRHALRAATSAELFDALQPQAAAFEEEEEEMEGGATAASAASSSSSSANDTVSSWMRSWTSFRGAPLLLVRLDEVTGDVHLEQATLMSSGGGGSANGSSDSGSDGSGIRAVPCDDASVVAPDGNPGGAGKSPNTMPPWWIPLRVATSARPKPHWLRGGAEEQSSSSSSRRRRRRGQARVLASCSTSAPIARLSLSSSSSSSSSSSLPSWIKVNAGAVAPVRVSYPAPLWLALARASTVVVGEVSPPTPLISGADLSQLLNDADALGEAGIAPVSAFLNLTRALGKRPPGNAGDDLGAWRAAAAGLRRMREFLSFSQERKGGKGKKCASDLDAYVSRRLLSRFVEFDDGEEEGENGGGKNSSSSSSSSSPVFSVAAAAADSSSSLLPPWSLLRALPRSASNALRATRALVLGLAADFGGGDGVGGGSGGGSASTSSPKSFEGVAWAALRRGLAAASSLSSSSSHSSSHSFSPSYLYLGDADARGVLYSSAVSAGGEEAFAAIKRIYEEQEEGGGGRGKSKTADPAERERALFALAHAGSEHLARAALDYSVSEKVRSQDAGSLASAVASANAGRSRRVCWDWLVGKGSNGAALLAAKKGGGGGTSGDGGARAVGRLFASIGGGLAADSDDSDGDDEERSLKKLEKEIESAAKTLKIKQRRHVDSALEGVRARWSWRRHNRDEACRWLAAEVGS